MFFFLIFGLYLICYPYYDFYVRETDSDIVAEGFTTNVPAAIIKKDVA